jgi:hypothetical protein
LQATDTAARRLTSKLMGDGVLAYFGFRRAHEEDSSENSSGEATRSRVGSATSISATCADRRIWRGVHRELGRFSVRDRARRRHPFAILAVVLTRTGPTVDGDAALRRRERGCARLAEVDRLERLQAWAVGRKPGSPKEHRYVKFDGHKAPGKQGGPGQALRCRQQEAVR